MGVFRQLHFSFGCIFYLQFQCEIWGLMDLSLYSLMLQCSDKLEIFLFSDRSKKVEKKPTKIVS